MNSTRTRSRSGKLMKGIMLGAAVGGAIAMLDSGTRRRVATKTTSWKDSTMGMVERVREDPSGVMNDWQGRLKSASAVLKDAINDAQSLYERVSDDIIEPVKEQSSELIASTKDAAEDLQEIGMKVKEAGEEIKEDEGAPTASSDQESIHPVDRPSPVPGKIGS